MQHGSWIIALGALCIVAACSAAPAPENLPETRPLAVQPLSQDQHADPPAPIDLKAFLKQLAQSQYATAESLSKPPPENLADKTYMVLAREQAKLILGSDVTDFVADEGGLAMCFEDGTIRVVGPWPCRSLALPGNQGAGLLGWASGSPFLAAANEQADELFLYDLRTCQLVTERSFTSPLTRLTVSSMGAWVAGIMAEHDLLVAAAARRTFQKLASLRYPALALRFTPREGVLMVVDQAGWLVLWAPLTGKQLQQTLIPGGPFKKARFDGTLLLLTPEEGPEIAYDISAQQTVPARPSTSPYKLANGVLTYLTKGKTYVRKLIMAPPRFSVQYAPQASVIRVDDVDGRSRYYSADDGLPTDPAPGGPQWRPVEADNDGRFLIKGREYALATRMAQWEHMRLSCRSLADGRFLLWWSLSPRPDEYDPHPGELPVRRSILADAPVTWRAVDPSGGFL